MEGGEEVGNGELLAWENEMGADIGEGCEDEASEVKSWVGDDELGVGENEISGVKDIEVDGAGSVAWSFGGATEIGFDVLERVEEGDGLAVEFDLDDGVEKDEAVSRRGLAEVLAPVCLLEDVGEGLEEVGLFFVHTHAVHDVELFEVVGHRGREVGDWAALVGRDGGDACDASGRRWART